MTDGRVAARLIAIATALLAGIVVSVAFPTVSHADEPVPLSSATDLSAPHQAVMSRLRTFSVVGTPESSGALSSVFGVAATTDLTFGGGLQSTTDDDGASYIRLSRRYPGYDYSSSLFNASFQYSAAYGNIGWGARLSSALASTATGPVTERTYWWVNNKSAGSSHHVQSPYYQYHGTMPSLAPGYTVDFASEYTFECQGGRATCIATLYASFYVVD